MVKPFATLALVGLIAIFVNSAAATVRVVLPEIVLPLTTLVAVIVALPTPSVVARPLILTVATALLLDDHVTLPDTLPALLSEKVPVAVKVTGRPLAMDDFDALTVMTVKMPEVTCTVTLLVVLP